VVKVCRGFLENVFGVHRSNMDRSDTTGERNVEYVYPRALGVPSGYALAAQGAN
jgi:hypothetical protein